MTHNNQSDVTDILRFYDFADLGLFEPFMAVFEA